MHACKRAVFCAIGHVLHMLFERIDMKFQSVAVTGPPIHNVGGRLVTVGGVCRRRLSSSFVTLPTGARAVGRPTLRGGPVMLRPVRETPCFT